MSRASFQFPSLFAEQVRAHAARLDRSVGWILVTAWRLAEPQAEQDRGGGADSVAVVGHDAITSVVFANSADQHASHNSG